MIKRVVAVQSEAFLSLKLEQMVVSRRGQPDAKVPIEDLGVLVLDHAPTSLTVPLLAALQGAGVAVLVCDPKHMPVGLMTPVEGGYAHGQVLREQVAQREPSKKRLWQVVVQAKVLAQADLLRAVGKPHRSVRALVAKVASGDATHVEGVAAAKYFDTLFGKPFSREAPGGLGVNAWLNYGYAVLRAAVARAVCGAGLHPALGIFHGSRYNAFGLADDLMEPLRPMVDRIAYQALLEGRVGEELDPGAKRSLLEVLTERVAFDGRSYPLLTALTLYAARYRDCVSGERRKLSTPASILPGAPDLPLGPEEADLFG